MAIIPRTLPSVEPLSVSNTWQQQLTDAFRDSQSLLDHLNLAATDLDARHQAALQFPVLVPRYFADLIEPGNPNDPLLLQVLPQAAENQAVDGYVADPLAEKHANAQRGILHKYHGRLLLLLATGCAVNCRYCFRRHFPYADNRIGQRHWQQALDYVAADDSVSEVILSGGDPLMVDDERLAQFVEQLSKIQHVKRLRVHSRLPVVIPDRLTDRLADILAKGRFATSLVLHINHPNEISSALSENLAKLSRKNCALFNQSVLLKHVNDSDAVLVRLSEQLFESGITPYYLHLLDPVAGAHHYDLPLNRAKALFESMQKQLPGYLLPKLVREDAEIPYKKLMK